MRRRRRRRRRRRVVLALVSLLASCAGPTAATTGASSPSGPAERKVRTGDYFPAQPGAMSPEEVGPPFTYMGKTIRIVRRTMLDDRDERFGWHRGTTYYGISVDDGEAQTSGGFTKVAYVEGIGLVEEIKGTGYGVFGGGMAWELQQLITAGDTLQDGRADRVLVIRTNGSAELQDRSGKTVARWDKILPVADKQYTRTWGDLTMLFVPGDNGDRQLVVFDKQLNTTGTPIAGTEELAITTSPTNDAPRTFVGMPVAGEQDLFTLLTADGSFAAPPGLVGLQPLTMTGKPGVLKFYAGAAWIMVFKTDKGRRYGWASTSFETASGPIWLDIKRVAGPEMTSLHSGAWKAPSETPAMRSYLVVKALDGTWQALLPEAPLRSPVKASAPTAEAAVQLAEKESAKMIAEGRAAIALAKAANEESLREERRKRVLGGQTDAKDADWRWVLQYQAVHGVSPKGTAMNLGGVYLVDYIEGTDAGSEELRVAASVADKFAPERAARIRTRADKIAKVEEQKRKDAIELARKQAFEEYARTPKVVPPIGQWEPSRTPTTYDYRTGVRSDTQQLKDWTYGRQNWKPLSQ